MASRASSRRPALRRDGSSTSTRSMTSRIDSIIDMYIDRPLPPTPGKPSASPLSFISHLSNGSSASLRSTKSEKSKQSNLLKRASRIPEQLRIKGGNLEKLIHGHQHDREDDHDENLVPDRTPRPWRLEDIHPGDRILTPPAWQEPTLHIDKGSTEDSSLLREIARRRSSKRKSKRGLKTASGGYFDQVSPQSPETAAVLLNTDSSYEPSPITPIAPWPEMELFIPMESRISNVMDQPIVPEVVDIAKAEEEVVQHEDRRLSGASSHLSETSSVLSGASSLGDLPTVFQNATNKEYGPRRRPSSKYPTEGIRPDSEYFHDGDGDDNSEDDGIHRSKSIFHKLRSNSLAAAEADLFDEDTPASPNPKVVDPTISPSEQRRRGSLSERLKSVKLRNPPLQVRVGHHPKVQKEPVTPKDDRFKAKKLLGSLPMGKEKRNQKYERGERVAELRKKIRHVLPEKPVDGQRF